MRCSVANTLPEDAQTRALVEMLVTARRERTQIPNLDPALVPATAADGYAINSEVSRRLGLAPLGWKIAATTPEMQQRLRATEPIYGRSFAPFAVASPARLPYAELLDPLIECEFLFCLARDLSPRIEPYTAVEVGDAVASVHAGIEIAECRFPLDQLPPMPAILADGAASGRYVIGSALEDWRSLDLAAMPVTLTVDGTVRRRGSGREVMGNPINAVVWLANQRSRWGDGLKAGEMISTGTATGMLLAKRGQTMRAEFGGRWTADVTFD